MRASGASGVGLRASPRPLALTKVRLSLPEDLIPVQASHPPRAPPGGGPAPAGHLPLEVWDFEGGNTQLPSVRLLGTCSYCVMGRDCSPGRHAGPLLPSPERDVVSPL